MGSNGSVVPFFIKKSKSGILPITNPEMTRFNISLEDGVKMVLNALENAWGGEIFIPKIPSYRILDIAEAVSPKCKIEIVGIRPGEKVHEEMITASDSFNTYDLGKYYVILPDNKEWSLQNYIKKNNAKSVIKGFSYNSGTNKQWETVKTLTNLIQKL